MAQRKIVILGAGFAGLQLARRLKKSDNNITLIDQYNFHQFQPLFYQVATARLEPSSISFPLRKVFQNSKNVHVRISKVSGIDTARQIVHTEVSGDFYYDELIVATGCTSNFFGNKGVETHSFPMKSTPEATALRNRILLNFEDALKATPEELEAIMNIVVVGGGPTGVELAGSLAEMKRNVLPKDYPDMDFSRLKIYLVEGSGHTLNAMSDVSRRKSQEYLEKMGVEIWLNAMLKDYDGTTVSLADGRSLKTKTLIWAAGVTGNVPPGIPQESLVRGNRIQVDEFHKVKGLEHVYALGDVCYMEAPDWPKGHPQLANVAINQAKNLARNFSQPGREKPFRYKNPGTMATVGKRKAVVDLPSFSFQGVLAWLTWMFLHLMLIVSVKNRLIIFINWAVSYLTNDTTLRLILLPTRKQIELAQEEFPNDIPAPVKDPPVVVVG